RARHAQRARQHQALAGRRGQAGRADRLERGGRQVMRASGLGPRASAALALLVAACGESKPAAIKTSSAPKPPAWLTRTTSDSQTLYFSGAKEGASSLDEGKESAIE